MKCTFLAMITTSCLLMHATAFGQMSQPQSDLGAKALFYNTEGAVVSVQTGADQVKLAQGKNKSTAKTKRQKQPPILALRASVFLVDADGGKLREVAPSYKFSTGDKIKLSFSTNKSGYFYLLSQGTSGQTQTLAPRKGEAAYVTAGNRYSFPAAARGSYKFEGAKGKEELWAIVSEEPIDSINLGNGQLVSIERPSDNKSTTNLAMKTTLDVNDQLASKDLIYEEDSEAAYVSVRPEAYHRAHDKKKPPILIKLTLNHL